MGENAPQNQLKKTADSLFKNNQIRYMWTHFDRHPRYINLRSQEMFDNLVNMYAFLFKTQWQHFSRFMDCFQLPTGVQPDIYAARCYISTWFINLYESNRTAVRKLDLSGSAFIERYHKELCSVTHEYDHYLSLLNASIRPTYLQNNFDNALYIPVISDSVDVNSANPFGINNFSVEHDIFYGLTQMMKEQDWNMTRLSASDKMGRPCWLFDWHSENHVCSWFSQEGNYDHEDVTLANILGTACTSNRGPRDDDDWQYLAQGIALDNVNPKSCDRVVERRFYGSYEVRTMEIDNDFSMSKGAKRRKRLSEDGIVITTSGDTSTEEGNQLMSRFKLIDWVYYREVVLIMDIDLRYRILRSISIKGFQEFTF